MNRGNLSNKETLFLLTNTFEDYTFYAKDHQIASWVISLLSDTDKISEVAKEMIPDIIHSLRSIIVGSLEERKHYEEYLSNHNNIQAQKDYIMAYNDSYNFEENMRDLAFNVAEKLSDILN